MKFSHPVRENGHVGNSGTRCRGTGTVMEAGAVVMEV